MMVQSIKHLEWNGVDAKTVVRILVQLLKLFMKHVDNRNKWTTKSRAITPVTHGIAPGAPSARLL